MSNTITEDDIRKKIVERLKYWQSLGVILNWERINSGRVQTFGRWFYGAKAGFPDYFAEVIMGKCIGICYFETKKPVGGIWSPEQREFADKHSGYLNVTYDLVTDATIIDERIDAVSKYTEKTLEDMMNHMGFNNVKRAVE